MYIPIAIVITVPRNPKTRPIIRSACYCIPKRQAPQVTRVQAPEGGVSNEPFRFVLLSSFVLSRDHGVLLSEDEASRLAKLRRSRSTPTVQQNRQAWDFLAPSAA